MQHTMHVNCVTWNTSLLYTQYPNRSTVECKQSVYVSLEITQCQHSVGPKTDEKNSCPENLTFNEIT